MKIAEMPLSKADCIMKEEEFFSKRFAISYSGLNKLSFCPQQFYDWYILQQREMNFGKAMLDGKLVHCLLLNPHEFDNMFVVTPGDLPSPNMLKILNEVFLSCKLEYGDVLPEITTYQTEFLDAFVVNNLYQSLKNDAGRVDKLNISKNRTYWEYLLTAEKRDVIDNDQLDEAHAIVEKIVANIPFMKLMGYYSEFENRTEQHNEIMLQQIVEERLFDLKGIIDNLVIDHTAKEIRINDLKKTGKDLKTFANNIDYFRYDLQAAMYYTLVQRTFGERFPDYKIVFRFMVVDSMLQIAPIRISDTTMAQWLINFDTMLNELEWHFKERRFDLPYSIAINNEILL